MPVQEGGAEMTAKPGSEARELTWSRSELMAIELAAHLRDDDVAVMGTASALPQVALSTRSAHACARALVHRRRHLLGQPASQPGGAIVL